MCERCLIFAASYCLFMGWDGTSRALSHQINVVFCITLYSVKNGPEVICQIGSAFESEFWILKKTRLLLLGVYDRASWVPTFIIWSFALRKSELMGGLRHRRGRAPSQHFEVTKGQESHGHSTLSGHLAGCQSQEASISLQLMHKDVSYPHLKLEPYGNRAGSLCRA